MKLGHLRKKELISLVFELIQANESLTKKVDQLTNRVVGLEAQLASLKVIKGSNNSSIPPSHDQRKVSRTQSLRKATGKKRGGQTGHKGHTLEMSSMPDQVIKHIADYCQGCGKGLASVPAMKQERRQVVDIPTISPVYTEHQAFSKACGCGYVTKGTFPTAVKARIQYGSAVTSLASYFSVRQYLPYQRMKECFRDLFGLSICEGSLVNAVNQMASKSLPVYQRIKENIERSSVVGADETGGKVNQTKHWFWTWQTPTNTLITISPNRGYKVIEGMFPDGLINSTLISDCWPAQLKTPAKNHQLCIAHLLRELNFFVELYDDPWSKNFRQLLYDALTLKKTIDYQQSENHPREHIISKLNELLLYPVDQQEVKVKPFHKRMCKYKDYLFPFLYQEHIPADNNASERAIRNIKVKQKISGQFINVQNAMNFAIIRSVIDTAIKNGANVMSSLNLIVKFSPE